MGRRDSLESLIRNHSYSTETVRRLLKPGALGDGMAPVGTLADFLEVSGEHEGVVDEFLRDELNYVVVESWRAAEEGVRVLKSGVDGTRHVPDSSRITRRSAPCSNGNGAYAISRGRRDAAEGCHSVLNGFGRSLEAILPKLRDGYLVETGRAGAATGERTYACILPDARRASASTTPR